MNEETDKAGSVPVKLNWQWPHLTLATETIKSVVQGNELVLERRGWGLSLGSAPHRAEIARQNLA